MSVIPKAENGGSSISRISTFVVESRKSITRYAILYTGSRIGWMDYPSDSL